MASAPAFSLGYYGRIAPYLVALASVAVALVPWLVIAALLQRIELAWWSTVILNLAAFAFALRLTRDSAAIEGPPRQVTGLRDLLLRALLAGSLAPTVVTVSELIGPRLTGSAVTFPVVLTTLGLIMHHRYGSHAASPALRAALLAMPRFSSCV